MSKNSFIVLGFVGADPELRYTGNGTPICKLDVATDDSYIDRKNNNTRVEVTDWHRLTAFDKRAELIAQYVKKGDKIYLEAKHKTRKFRDEEQGKDRYVEEFIITFVDFMTKKGVRDPGDDDQRGGEDFPPV